MDNYVMFPPQPDLAQEVQRMQGTLSRLVWGTKRSVA